MARADRPLGRHFGCHIAPSSLSIDRSCTGGGPGALGMVGRRGTDHTSVLPARRPRRRRSLRRVRVRRGRAPRERAVGAFATLLVAPAPSAMRIAGYFAVGIQGFVVAALLIARQGGASLAFDAISPTAVSPGAILAATAGAGLFAGLYPFV